MDYSRKMALVPFQATENQIKMDQQPIVKPEVKKPKLLTNTQKIQNVINIVLKIAKVNGYDESGRIKSPNGDYVERSNIIHLLNNALSSGKVLFGESEFVELLKEAKIEPHLIINENVRNKLLGSYTTMKTTEVKPIVSVRRVEDTPIPRKRKLEETKPVVVIKRKLEENDSSDEDQESIEEDNTPKNYLKRIGWEVPKKKVKYE